MVYIGSPPLARGVRVYPSPYESPIGITPACAGSTGFRSDRWKMIRDHPRLRGEYSMYPAMLLLMQGSPPLARGVLYYLFFWLIFQRITPACAGSTFHIMEMPMFTRDHPRLRGEYISIFVKVHPCQGSPPLARGVP